MLKAPEWVSYPAAAAVSGEGSSIVFVDTFFGSDEFGNGTRDYPYKRLRRGYDNGVLPTEHPSIIVFRGVDSSPMMDGNMSTTIRGDFWGAAVFDGQGKYCIYGFTHTNLFIINTVGSPDELNVNTYVNLNNRSERFCGVGRALGTAVVGGANYVGGVAGSSNLIDNCVMYWGAIGGDTNATRIVYSNLQYNGLNDYKLQFISSLNYCTVFNARIEKRMRSKYIFSAFQSLFSQVDFFADETQKFKFDDCMFTSDCRWFYTDKIETGTPLFRIELGEAQGDEVVFTPSVDAATGENVMTITGYAAEGMYAIEAAIYALKVAGRITVAVANLVFTDCIFSELTSEDVFINTAALDFQLKPGTDAIIKNVSSNNNNYYGALAPARNVPILKNSQGVPESWEEDSAQGFVKISDDNEIIINTDLLPSNETGSITSKVLRLDPREMILSGVFSMFTSKMYDYGCRANTQPVLDEKEYVPGEELPVGTYHVRQGTAIFDKIVGVETIPYDIEAGNSFIVKETGRTFAQKGDVPATCSLVIDSNIMDVMYIRMAKGIFIEKTPVEDLQIGGVYRNNGNKNIVYKGRTVVPTESFTVMDGTLRYSVENEPDNETYKLGVVFDNEHPGEWIPYRMWGEAFAYFKNGELQRDTDGVPISSGNYRSFLPKDNGGYSNVLTKSWINEMYIQLGMFVTKYRNI